MSDNKKPKGSIRKMPQPKLGPAPKQEKVASKAINAYLMIKGTD